MGDGRYNAQVLIGERFGKLTVLSDSGIRAGTNIMWYCKCDCGKHTIVRGANLTGSKTRSCGCLRGVHQIEDLTGQRFNKLLVIGRAENHKTPSGAVFSQWLCRCDCGNLCVKTANHLKTQSYSCGCSRRSRKSQS